jgi:hypothetical protein
MVKALLGIALSLVLVLSATAATPSKKMPEWQELSAEQRTVLNPLSSVWNGFTAQRKKMWIDIAARYPGMNEEDQAKVQRRMQRWVKLSQEERRTVRENFKKIQKLPPEKKQSLIQEWDEYRKLPEEERRKLGERSAKSAAKDNAGKSPSNAGSQPPAANPQPR